jgi:predicted dehydrogenase
MLKIGIVGCGKIADSHAAQIQRIKGTEIVGVCDREPLMAQQLCDRFSVKQSFMELPELLERAKPDVVHITTPPQIHFEAAKLCLQAGCHVYVEKPFTVNEREARELIALANERGLKLTAGHDNQFRRAAIQARELVRAGYLGGNPVHMESYFCYELGPGGYAGVLLSDKQHWVRRLPGQLLHNIISHGIARIAEFLQTESPQVIAYGFVSPFLRSLGEREIVDELRVIISEECGTTAYFTFSSQMRPSLHQFRLYGPKNGLMVDQDQDILIKLPGLMRTSYLEQFVSPAATGWQYFGNTWSNVRTFLHRDFHPKAGMKHLIESFYHSILEDTPVPIPYREIILTTRIMDAIFTQLAQGSERQLIGRQEGEEAPLAYSVGAMADDEHPGK